MKIVFFGNTKYSLIGLKILQENLGISLVVTIPASPTESFAKEQNIPVATTKRITPEIIEEIKKLFPDIFIVEDYGLILPKEILEVPRLGALNIHHSLLPNFRGPSPAPAAILAGIKTSGVTIIRMIDEVDAGNILAQKTYEMKGNETTDSLLQLLNIEGAQLITEIIQKIDKGLEVKEIPQDIKMASWTQKMKKEDGRIDFSVPLKVDELNRKIRAYYPWPGVYLNTSLNGQEKMVKFLPQGHIQVEGKKQMSYKSFINGYGHDAQNILQKLGLLDN